MLLNKKNLDKKILAVLIGCFLWYYVDSTSTIKQDLYGDVRYKDLPADLAPVNAPAKLKYYLKTNRYHTERLSTLNVWFEISLKNTVAGNNFVNVEVKTNDLSRLPQVELPNEVIKILMDKRAEKTVGIQASIHSRLFPDFRVENLVISPSSARIEGPETLISKVKEIFTEDLNLERPGVFNFRVKIKPIKGIKIDTKLVQCQFKIVQNLLTQDLYLPVKWVNINKNLAVKRYSPMRVFIKIQGASENMKKVDFKELFYYIDLKEIKNPGRYSLPLEIRRIEGIEIVSGKSLAEIEMIKSSE